jgi:hypothetical protein
VCQQQLRIKMRIAATEARDRGGEHSSNVHDRDGGGGATGISMAGLRGAARQ